MTLLIMGLLLLHSFPVVYASISPIERVFLSVPNASAARDSLRFLTAAPHVAGTVGDQVMARYVENSFRQAGIPNVSTFHLDVLLNYPKRPPQVSVHNKDNHNQVLFQANLSEPAIDFDDTSNHTQGWNKHIFHGYGASGTVMGPVVYANYGRPQDFDALDRAGISVEQTIVLVRYGKCFRGLKVMNAQERGALGVIIYSDPYEDGVAHGKTYPAGPWRPSTGIQRGSVQFNSKCAGDPMRADRAYHNGTASNQTVIQRICGVKDYTDLIPSIPSVPMGSGDAEQILDYLGGPKAGHVFDDFHGGLPIDYHVGPSQETVLRLSTDHIEVIRSIPNVVGYIPGTLPPDQDMPVLLGNHRDAWVFGAADPNSGTAGLIEVARAFSKLLETGWAPRRSIYLLSWSGEEYGLLGSTGWAELNAFNISHAVAYLNADTLVSGDLLSVATTPSLVTLWEGVLDDLHADDEANEILIANGPRGLVRDANTNQILNHPKHGLLGSGSDYTVFLDHFGISSLDFSFGKSTTYGQYHSIYDSFSWMNAYGGKDGEAGSAFRLLELGSKIWGLLAIRLADSVVLPFDHMLQGEALLNYTSAIEEQHRGLDLSSLKAAVHRYLKAASDLHAACGIADTSPSTLDPATCNYKLGLTERQFVTKKGLPGRKWFKHVLQAPGFYLGYAAEAFPGIQEAIDANDMHLAQQQVSVAASCVEKAASFMSDADLSVS